MPAFSVRLALAKFLGFEAHNLMHQIADPTLVTVSRDDFTGRLLAAFNVFAQPSRSAFPVAAELEYDQVQRTTANSRLMVGPFAAMLARNRDAQAAVAAEPKFVLGR